MPGLHFGNRPAEGKCRGLELTGPAAFRPAVSGARGASSRPLFTATRWAGVAVAVSTAPIGPGAPARKRRSNSSRESAGVSVLPTLDGVQPSPSADTESVAEVLHGKQAPSRIRPRRRAGAAVGLDGRRAAATPPSNAAAPGHRPPRERRRPWECQPRADQSGYSSLRQARKSSDSALGVRLSRKEW
jgi:hypothetical protein